MTMQSDAAGAHPDTAPMDSIAMEARPTYKSWKKKFRKMKFKFEQKMREGDQLFREEQQAHDTTRRLAEGNDQLLELLLDVNESIHIPPHHRYDLGIDSSTPSSSAVPALEPDIDSSTSAEDRAKLGQAAADLEAGRISAEDYDQLQATLVETRPKPFKSLLSVPHTTLASLPIDQIPESLKSSPPPPTFLSSAQEEEYIFALDQSVDDPTAQPPYSSKHGACSEREKDRDLALRNPVSVYNWLRRHQPQVFLQDNEGIPEKTGAKSSRGAGKRGSVAAKAAAAATAAAAAAASAPVADHLDFVDDDSLIYGPIDVPAAGSGKGRKKKDDDGGYRPKGGGSKAGKRKRDSDAAGAGSSTASTGDRGDRTTGSSKKLKRLSANSAAAATHHSPTASYAADYPARSGGGDAYMG